MNNQSNLAAKILFDHRMNKKGIKSLPKNLLQMGSSDIGL